MGGEGSLVRSVAGRTVNINGYFTRTVQVTYKHVMFNNVIRCLHVDY